MVTDGGGPDGLILALGDARWDTVRVAVDRSEAWLKDARPGDPGIARVGEALAALGSHAKWEVRRAIANLAGRIPLPVFETMLMQLRGDENERVRLAARQAQLRRRDWRSASSMGRDQEKRINAAMEEIERRFGLPGRVAVRKAAEGMASMFAREVYHEIIRFISPIMGEAEKLGAERIMRQTERLRSVLEGMRTYAMEPVLEYDRESVRSVVDEAAQLTTAGKGRRVEIEVDVAAELTAEVARPRLVQAFVNVLVNAVEAYEGVAEPFAPIVIRGSAGEGYVELQFVDRGCGMGKDALEDARKLFATSKQMGAGVGLPLAIKIVETEHDGRVTLLSEEGMGTLVQITLPMARTEVA